MDSTKESPTVLSICTGYGGMEIGLGRALGKITTLAFVEVEAFADFALVEKMEKNTLVPIPIWTDVKTLNGRIFRDRVDILTAGFPCQPFSCAGTQKGTDDPRHLWPYIEKTIAECRPQSVFLENVEGIISTKTLLHRPKLKEYCQEAESRLGGSWGLTFRNRLTKLCGISVLRYVKWRLERLGYRCESGIFSASEVGAPHQRKRVFILAKSKSQSNNGRINREIRSTKSQRGCFNSETSDSGKNGMANSELCSGGARTESTGQEERSDISGGDEESELGNSESNDKRRSSKPTMHRKGIQLWPAGPGQPQYEWEEPRIVVNPGSKKQQRISQSEERNEDREVGKSSGERSSQPFMGGAVDGTRSELDPNRNRVDRLRLLGNGVMPDQAEKAFLVLHEKLTKQVDNIQLSF